ncbi:MAG: RNA methyltransferase [Actinomycetota bacterium]|nr:RNA methyltransferase [Actinomycetota bacterium]
MARSGREWQPATPASPGRIRAARQLAKRALRERSRQFLAEGPQAVREALAGLTASAGLPGGPAGPPGDRPGSAGPSLIRELFVTAQARARHLDLVDAVRRTGVPVHEVSGEIMADLAQTVTPQGLLAVCPYLDVPLPDLLAAGPRLVVVLANVRDPGNAGTVLRSADAAGAGGVIFAGASVDPYNSKCVRSSAGSLFHLPVVTGVPVTEAVAALRAAGLVVLAADGSGPAGLDDLADDGSLGRPTAWLFGNEAWGLPADLVGLADTAVAVPIYGRAESLNLAAAAAVCLYASARAQRREPDRAGDRDPGDRQRGSSQFGLLPDRSGVSPSTTDPLGSSHVAS